MEECKTGRIHYVEVAKDIYAAITPAEGMDITDAGLMDNFSNSAYINRGEGLVCDTFFDLPHARDLLDFCQRHSGHAPGYVVNTHGHWDHFWGNQVFAGAKILGHRDMLADCSGDEKKVPVFRFLHNSKGVQSLMSGVLSLAFRKHLPAGVKAKFVVRLSDHDFDLTDVKPRLPDTLIGERTVLDLDGLEVHLIPLGAIHSSSDMVVWIPEAKVLFAGDIFADCSLPMSLEKGKLWLSALDYILDELRPEVIVPGHGEVYDRARAENQREYFRSLMSQVESAYTPGMKKEEVVSKIDIQKYLDHRPRLAWVMAINTMIGELQKKK